MLPINYEGVDPNDIHVTPQQFAVLQDWFKYLNTVSLVLAFVTTVTNLATPKKRAFPSRLTTCFAFAAFGFHAGLSLSYFEDWGTVVNVPPGAEPARWSSCEVQGIVFAYFSSAVVFWWLLISFNLHRVVHFELSLKEAKTYEVYFHLAGWGVPFLQICVLFAFHGYGTEVGALYCWITVRDGAVWKVVAFYAILTVFSLLGIAWSIRIIRKLSKYHRRRMKLQRAARKRAIMRAQRSRRSSAGGSRGLSLAEHDEAASLLANQGGEESDTSRGDDLSVGGRSPGWNRHTAGSDSSYAQGAVLARTGTDSSAALASTTGDSTYFSYYVWRQAMFMLVMLVRFVGFVAWQINYMLFSHGDSVITFPLCFIVNYLVCSVGLDTFLLICLTRENTARLSKACTDLAAGRFCRRTAVNASVDGADTDAESVTPSGGLAAMTPERPKRAPLNI